MATRENQQSPHLMPQLKPEEQDSPTSQFGKYGLYRVLLRMQQAHPEPENPVSRQVLMAANPAPRKRGTTLGSIF